MIALVKSNLHWLKPVIGAIVIASLITAFGKSLGQLQLSASVNWFWLVGGAGVAIVYRVVNAHGWHLVLKAMRTNIGPVQCLRIWLTAEACRWLPGGIWGYGSRAVQAKQAGATSTVAAASLVAELGAVIGVAVLVSSAGLLLHFQDLAEAMQAIEFSVDVGYFGLGGIVAVMLVFTGWQQRQRIGTRVSSLRQKLPVWTEFYIDWRCTPRVLGFYALMALVNGTLTWSMLLAIDSEISVPFSAVVAATSAAWLVGFFAFAAPGGLVVREAMMASLLVTWVPLEVAVSAAILARLSHIVAEAFWVAMVYFVEFTNRRTEAALTVAPCGQAALNKANPQ